MAVPPLRFKVTVDGLIESEKLGAGVGVGVGEAVGVAVGVGVGVGDPLSTVHINA